MSGQVLWECEGAVAQLIISNTAKRNAMSRAMWRSLARVAKELQAQRSVRVVVVRGAQGQFCAGGDIAEYPTFRWDRAQLTLFHEEEVWPALEALLACDVPLVAAIEGACMGAGMEIACCCDLRLASPNAQFGAPIAKLGFPMAPRELELVAARAGQDTARAMLLAAAVLNAQTLHQRGFVHQICDEAQVLGEALALAHRMAQLAPEAARLNKQCLRQLASAPAATLVATAYDYADNAEHREGISAFLDKRVPRF